MNSLFNQTPIFLADCMLGKLSRYLRLAGFNTAYRSQRGRDPIQWAVEQGRILLTRNLSMIRTCESLGTPQFFHPDHNHSREQFRLVAAGLNLLRYPNLEPRCAACNGNPCQVDKKDIRHLIPEYIFRQHSQFKQCTDCGKCYWPGSHISGSSFIEEFFQKKEQ